MEQPLVGTSIYVDNFVRAGSAYILTHTHTDHLRGLHNGWSYGEIHCTSASAKLLMLHYPSFRTSLLVLHGLEQPLEIGTGITATFVDANHCTGSVLVVFEGDGLRDGPVVNSGDFRFCEALLGSPALQRVALAVDGKPCQQLRLDVSWEQIDRLPSKATSAELLLEELS